MSEPAVEARRRAPAKLEWRVFWLSWTSYFSYYFTRANFSVAKTPMKKELHLTKGQLGWIDTASLAAYCVGQFVHGALGDVIGPRRLIAFGMLASAGLSALFGTQSLLGVFILLWGLNGFVQATGWPSNGKLMASWFSTRERGERMALWSTCYQAGGVAAKLFATSLLYISWRAAFLGPALWVACVAGAIWLFVRDRPSDLGWGNPDIGDVVDAEALRAARRAAWPDVLGNVRTWCLGLNYFCLKMMRYAFIYWLPYFLHEAYKYSDTTSGYVSIALEVGGIPFVILAGYLADRRFGRRRIAVATVSCAALAGALALYEAIGAQGVALNIVGLMLIGGCLYSADTLVSGSASQDLGGPHAGALACGIVNGIGSIGGVVQSFVTVYISDRWGWHALFEVFIGLALVSTLPLLPFWRVRPELETAAAVP